MRVEFKLLIFSLMVMFLTSTVFSQNSENVVAEFSGHEITLGEFEKAYAKNVGGSEMAVKDSLQDYKNFLDLYVVYKMKLRDAYVRDYRNDEDLTNELDDYKEKVGVSYIQEKKIVSPGMKRFYDERGEEVRVSHIMFKKGADSDESLKQAEAILDSIKNGKTFEEMVPIYSQDNFSKNKGGDIYWFTAGQIVPAFEEGAYSTKVGEIYQKIITTKHGFHIIKVTDRAKRKYKIRAKHILVKSAEQENNMVDALPGEKPLAKATRIYEEVMNGADFDSLARKYSDDPGSGAKGGDLGLFGRRQMVQPFDEAVFALEVNEVSKLVKTRFGYHIIKLTEVLEYPTFENEIENLRDVYKKSRYQYDYDKYISGVKEECKFS